MTDEVIPLGDDRFEQKVAVDRRRLEAMITGKSDDLGYHYPNADYFFQDVMSKTGALISWPAQLKIGAKTKRDPFVKVQGTVEQLIKASKIIAEQLQTKKARITLKMEIHHSLHSNLIGKGGRGIQQIMRLTQCHIHFPDSNKYSENQMKSDQVSISGAPEQVDSARKYLRDILPFSLTFELPWLNVGQPASLSTDVVTWQALSGGMYLCTIRGTYENELTFLHGFNTALQRFGLTPEYPVVVSTTVPVKTDTLRLLKTSENWQKILDLSCDLVTPAQSNEGFLVLTGPISGVLAARKLIIGLSPAILSFDAPTDNNLTMINFESTKISMNFKRRSQAITTVILKGLEENIPEMFLVKLQTMGEVIPATSGTQSHLFETPLPLETTFDYHSGTFDLLRASEPKSPDPEDSPLAASILKGVKDIDKNTGNWKRKNNRDQMLLKAAQVVFDELPGNNPRYPTDHWAGYGLSYSLPADLLKGLLSQPQEEPQGRLIEGRNARSPPRNGLCSLREEDEMSDFSDSLSSRSNRSRNMCFEPRRAQAFSASTSMFDTGPAARISDFTWDIRNFTDPAMVLTQLGCSEYLALMREQEIDMHAFLLLDEQNLKDIGVSTIGARKKIHHAIRKLRESARHHGYAI